MGMRAEDRRQKILMAAQQLFIERGFEQVTMGDIAAALGTSRPTIYTYFSTTTAILEDLFESGLARVWSRVEPLVAATNQDPASPGSQLAIAAAFEILIGEPGFLAVLHSGGTPAFQRRRRELLNERFASLIEPYLRPDHGPYAIPMLVTLFDGMAYWASMDDTTDLPRLRQDLTEFVLHGLANRLRPFAQVDPAGEIG